MVKIIINTPKGAVHDIEQAVSEINEYIETVNQPLDSEAFRDLINSAEEADIDAMEEISDNDVVAEYYATLRDTVAAIVIVTSTCDVVPKGIVKHNEEWAINV